MKSGDVIGGKYRLTERLGRGGMGAVWEAVNERTGRKVALKLILHPTDELRERLRREARACGRLSHRNVVEIYDVDETSEGDPFLVMQLLRGQTLAELLAVRRRLDPALSARIGRDIAEALSAAHAAKVVHRDLKPANIFLHRGEPGGERGDDDFVVKVVDFGVSKMLASTDGSGLVTSALVGSPAYMSPEQLQMVKDLDPRTDLWSLGIVLYEMLTGKRPFSGTVQDVIRRILTAPIEPPSHHVRHLPRELDAIVLSCLERDRDKRIRSAGELARLLGSVQFVEGDVPVDSKPSLEKDCEEIEVDEPETGTRILSPDEPIVSPLPEWRRAVAARREAGETTTTTPYVRRAAVEAAEAPPSVAGGPNSRRMGRERILVPIGIGVAVIASVILVLSLRGAPEAQVDAQVEEAPIVATNEAVKQEVKQEVRPAEPEPPPVEKPKTEEKVAASKPAAAPTVAAPVKPKVAAARVKVSRPAKPPPKPFHCVGLFCPSKAKP